MRSTGEQYDHWPLPHLSVDAARSLRKDLTLQIQTDNINHLERVVLSKEEERNELHRNLNDAMDESSDEAAESAAVEDASRVLW